MTRQYSTIFYNTVECDKNKIQKKYEKYKYIYFVIAI